MFSFLLRIFCCQTFVFIDFVSTIALYIYSLIPNIQCKAANYCIAHTYKLRHIFCVNVIIYKCADKCEMESDAIPATHTRANNALCVCLEFSNIPTSTLIIFILLCNMICIHFFYDPLQPIYS